MNLFTENSETFCADSNFFIESWQRNYPIEVFLNLWDQFIIEIQSGTLLVVEQVFEELGRKDDDLFAWAKSIEKYIIPGDTLGVQESLRSILVDPQNQRILQDYSSRNYADPWVVALAQATRSSVVTLERFEIEAKRVKIPHLCLSCNIAYLNVAEFFQQRNYRFKLEK